VEFPQLNGGNRDFIKENLIKHPLYLTTNSIFQRDLERAAYTGTSCKQTERESLRQEGKLKPYRQKSSTALRTFPMML